MAKAAFAALFALLLACALPPGAAAQEFGALARLDPAGSAVEDRRGGGVELRLAMSQPVPYRAFTLDGPPRLVLDFRELDFGGTRPEALLNADGATGLRYGPFRPGWSRMVTLLAAPMAIETVGLAADPVTGAGRLEVRLAPVDAARFAEVSGAPPGDPLWGSGPVLPPPAPRGDGPLVVVLDPGHGGIDPGAERDGLRESELMLTFARDLREALVRVGGFEVHMTRQADVFVPLEARVRLAHEAGADVFLSLHADALPGGGAHGATVYTLSEEASDEASARLAQSHNRADLIAGLDLSATDDAIASVLMDIARHETAPRAERLAEALADGIGRAGASLNSRPLRHADFAVLRSADIPSVLVEVGFLSSAQDRARLRNPAERARIVAGIAAALIAWSADDAARAALLRR